MAHDKLKFILISEGTLTEFRHFIQRNARAKSKKDYKIFVREFDFDWKKYADEYKDEFKDLIPLLKLG